ncbi:MAG: hypothetical protein JSW27_04900 [Phycisphaerales bacterium]|nr:MAG: hypothetical protein JSW27_04900 [Phycisphaerales bacterium]
MLNFRRHRGGFAGTMLRAALVLCLVAMTTAAVQAEARWWKGNLHTHTFWSDGDDFPEMVMQWYKNHGYHFLALSDHNVLSQGQRWMVVTDGRRAAFEKYRDRFGDRWIETRQNEKDQTEVRLKPLSECRCLFEEPNRFLLIQAEEISDKAHLNGINLLELIAPQGGATMAELLQNNIGAVRAQAQKTGRSMLVHINHPNFQWALTAEDMLGLKGMVFFEVYNAHGYVNNEGNELRASTERMWDILLTKRLGESKAEIVYAVATDDTHNYHKFDPRAANPGQAWVVVRAAQLTPESIIRAMDAGDFYCSTGVTLKDIAVKGQTLTVTVADEPGVTYTTQFIGTRRGYDPGSHPVKDAEGKELRTTRLYSRDIGRVLAEEKGTTARYTLKGDEIYVRAKVISSRKNDKSHVPGEREAAWTQPVVGRQ